MARPVDLGSGFVGENLDPSAVLLERLVVPVGLTGELFQEWVGDQLQMALMKFAERPDVLCVPGLAWDEIVSRLPPFFRYGSGFGVRRPASVGATVSDFMGLTVVRTKFTLRVGYMDRDLDDEWVRFLYKAQLVKSLREKLMGSPEGALLWDKAKDLGWDEQSEGGE